MSKTKRRKATNRTVRSGGRNGGRIGSEKSAGNNGASAHRGKRGKRGSGAGDNNNNNNHNGGGGEGKLPWPPGLRPTFGRQMWFRKFADLPAGLTRPEIAERLGISYALALRYVKLFGYSVKRQPGSGLWKRKPNVNWETVDWAQKDADVARVLGVSRERVRQVRASKGLPPSPRGSRNRHLFTKFVESHQDALSGLPMPAIIARSGVPLSEYIARDILKDYGLDKPPERSWSSRLNWRLPDGDLAEIWGVPRSTVRAARLRERQGPPRWSRPGGGAEGRVSDHNYQHALRNERVRAKRFAREVARS